MMYVFEVVRDMPPVCSTCGVLPGHPHLSPCAPGVFMPEEGTGDEAAIHG